ncbi:cytochrome b/b6 domain-containing protein [Erythrobacter sp. NFXS35]|uniref:cytochrome b n=1 Tax=Erythrobacter sp. NFXS35 TaxID=2818436 RepID=UPI0032E00566
MTTRVTRFHPLLVGLHWVIAVLIIGNLAAGKLLLDNLADSDPEKLDVLRLHMLGGLAILGLLVFRLVTRFATAKPGPAHESGPLKWLTAANHAALYLAALAMTVTGLGMAQLAGLFPLLEGKPVTLPEDWSAIAPHAGHELFSGVLIGLILLHFAGALYHMLKRDGVAGRMWFGKRKAD